MKYLQNQLAAGVNTKVVFVMLAGFTASLLLSVAMVSLVVKWLVHN
jgi:hypothetical protein